MLQKSENYKENNSCERRIENNVLLIGPPVVLLTSIALVTGFLLLLTAWCWPLATLFGGVTHVCLAGCDLLVGLGMRLPGAYWFVPDLPEWWLWVFYLGLLAVMAVPALRRRWALAAGLGWLCLGLLLPFFKATPAELRCTFVAVGHGGCTVIQTPDGRTLLYDAGAIQGPNVTRRNIVPFCGAGVSLAARCLVWRFNPVIGSMKSPEFPSILRGERPMNKITIDPELRARLDGLKKETMVCDERDDLLGYFVPWKAYQELILASAKIPFSEEEIARLRSEKGGCSLEEFWERMEQK
jgi:hypothetical protein